MELKDLIQKAKEVKDKYASLDQRPWGVAEYTQGFVKDVGDLTKLVMAKNGFRKEESVDEKLEHELCDCLWSVLVIADELGIDIENEFPKQMESLKEKIK